MDKVSIIIPCYNYGRYLGEAIESAQCQIYKNIEIIVVNDGSTDNTVEVANSYNVVLINTMNRSVSHARNIGIKKATGKYIVCLDADDKLHSEYIATLIPFMKSYDIVGTWAELFGDRRGILTYSDVKEVTHAMLRQKNYVHTSAMFKKSLFKNYGGFDEQLVKGYEDWEYWRRLAANGASIMIYHRALLYYRKHGSTRNDIARKHSAELVKYIDAKDKRTGIDVVIPMGTGSQSGDNELRFCLRAIERLLKGYRNIYIVGHLPRWCTNVVHVKHNEYHPKANNIHDKIAAACNHPDITDDFILFNDDYFLVQAVDAPIYPYYYSDSALDEVMQRPKADPYRRLVVDTYSEINTARYYDIHCPIVINKEAFLSQPYNRKYEGGILVKTSYCAHFQPINSIKRADPILRDKHTIEEIRAIELTTDLISIHDTAINPDLIEWIETKYPYPSSYEK